MMQFPDYPSVILLGYVGSGKTTLLNKICKSNEKSKSGGNSVTRNIFLKASAYGNGFLIMDTPGYGSNISQMAHISAIYAAVIERPLNRIVIVVEWNRFSTMIQQIKPILRSFDRYKYLIVLAVTYWDKIEDPKESEQELKTGILEQLGLKQYILIGKTTTGEEICKQMDKLLINTESQVLNLSQIEFLQQYDLGSSDFINDQLSNSVKQIQTDFNKICLSTQKFISSQDGQLVDTAELMHALIVEIKQTGHRMIEKFQQDQSLTFDILLKEYDNLEAAYLFPMHLKKIITEQMQKVIVSAQDKMKVYPFHIFNFIKQCDNCGLIWLKVSGCPNTTCGAFPATDEAHFAPKFVKFFIQLTMDNVYVKKQDIVQSTAKQYVATTNNDKKLKGCGKSLNWDALPLLPNEILFELKNTGFLDFIKMSYDDAKTKEIEEFWDTTKHEILKQKQAINVDYTNVKLQEK